MSMALFVLDDFEETRVEWIPLFKPLGLTVASIVVGDRCRDCGAREGTSWVSVPEVGFFMVCDECAKLDDCTTRKHSHGPDWHVSHWGERHRADEHDALVAAQERRRAAYLRRIAKAKVAA